MAGNNVYEELSPIHVYRWQSFLTFLYGWFCLQTRPVPFKVRAVVTSSDIEFNMQDIDFGFCTVYESVRRTVTITNKSVLPQPFGFCGVPDVSEITFQEWDCFVPRRVIRIPESGKFFSWRGIPESRVLESRIQLKESGIHSLESRVQSWRVQKVNHRLQSD